MKLFYKSICLALAGIAMLFSLPAQAQQNQVHFGGGISSNTLDVPYHRTATGYQFFGGLQLSNGGARSKTNVLLELGYMDSGWFDYYHPYPYKYYPYYYNVRFSGLWSTAVMQFQLAPKWDFIARLGADFGEADGLMAGIGIEYGIDRNLAVRFEYVQRDPYDSAQLNLVYYH
ncbi:MAG: hypothetical protein OEW58_09110 [Gammaproteobacteria bacterium]|nr:hypothetical protein [Gammaproteobacteria bacterium]